MTSDLPTASAAIILPTTSTAFSGTSLTAKAVWAAATDKSSAIAGYEVELRVDSGSWGSTRTLSALAARQTSFGVAAGHTYSTRVRAKDAADNWSTWVESAAVKLAVTQESSTAVAYGGTWSRWTNSWLSGGAGRLRDPRGGEGDGDVHRAVRGAGGPEGAESGSGEALRRRCVRRVGEPLRVLVPGPPDRPGPAAGRPPARTGSRSRSPARPVIREWTSTPSSS